MKILVKTLCLISMLCAQPVKAEKILAIGDLWPPWNLGQEGKEPTGGIAVNIAQTVFEEAKLDYKLMLYPWPRCLNMMKIKKADVAWFLTKNNDRKKYMHFSEPILVSPYLIYFTTDKNFRWNNFEELKLLKIGITRGFNYGDKFWAAAKKYKFMLEKTSDDNKTIKMLLSKRVDIIILNKSVAQDIISKNIDLKGKLTYSLKPVSQSTYYMALSRKKRSYYKLLPKINEAIKTLKSKGIIEKIVNNQVD